MLVESPHRTHRRNTLLRAFAVPLAWICLVAQLSGFAHFFVVQHAICPEHAEVIEIHDDGLAQHHAAQNQSNTYTTDATQHSGGHIPHDHCVLAALQHNQLSTQPSAATTLSQTGQRLPPVPSHTVFTDGIPLYSLAPKNSPPAV